jgi:hypothetical protein
VNAFILSLSIFLFATIPAHAVEPADEKRLDEVAERGTHVMPFDLEKTTHVFSKTADGGIQQVIAKDKSDAEQIQLIRDHLSEISEEFRQGDFSKPAQIHGGDMPGLAELKTANPDQIKIEYRVLPEGAQINYSTKFPQLIRAIHQWFDAQLSDHERHAVHGHSHQHMHQQ